MQSYDGLLRPLFILSEALGIECHPDQFLIRLVTVTCTLLTLIVLLSETVFPDADIFTEKKRLENLLSWKNAFCGWGEMHHVLAIHKSICYICRICRICKGEFLSIKYFLYYKRVRARLVRRLIWVEDLLCSNHNNPKYDFK